MNANVLAKKHLPISIVIKSNLFSLVDKKVTKKVIETVDISARKRRRALQSMVTYVKIYAEHMILIPIMK